MTDEEVKRSYEHYKQWQNNKDIEVKTINRFVPSPIVP